MGDMEGRKKNLGLGALEANIFPNCPAASFFLAFEADGLLFKKDFHMETNPPADDQSPETPLIEPIPPAAEAVGEHPALAHEDAPAADASAELDIPEDADNPEEAAPGSEAPQTSPEGEAPAGNELMDLALASQKARLSPADEERMSALLKEALQSGRAGVARAVETLPLAPWIVSVRSVEAVWKDLTAGFRTQLLAGLGKDESDGARRLRLSLARALFKIDAPVALKVAVAVAKEMRDKDSGLLAPKHAQIFSNVFIGRAKPWLGQLPLAELKPAEADVLVHCAVLAVFTVPHPPVTQLGVLKWAQENGRLGKLHEAALEAVKKGVSRWSGKWQGALRKEVADLPEEIQSALKPLQSESAQGPERESAAREEQLPDEGTDEPGRERGEAAKESEPGDRNADDEEDDEDDDEELERVERPRKERLVYEPRPQRPQGSQGSQGSQESPRERDRDAQKERPVYTPRNAGSAASQKFNLHEAFRQIEAHVQSLRNDLAAAQAKTRQKDDDRRRPEKSGVIIAGERTPEELARLNLQLEARNLELQSRITELTQHSEDLATSMGVMADQPVTDAGAQLRSLLALKLQEDFADFIALEKESNDLVVQQHYKGLLRHVFEVLTQLEVPLKTENS
jgi:hypothetical protein